MSIYITFNYIRNKIRRFKKDELLVNLSSLLRNVDLNKKKNYPIWDVFLLVKLTHLYAEQNYPIKPLTKTDFIKLLGYVEKLQNNTYDKVRKNEGWESFFQILSYQQFYLQKVVFWDDFSRQMLLFNTIASKYDIKYSFYEKTGLSIEDFIKISFAYWIYIESNNLGTNTKFYNGYLNKEDIQAFTQMFSDDKVDLFIKLLTLKNDDAIEKILNYSKSFKNGDLQPFEISVFTLYPFHEIQGKTCVIHSSIYNYTCTNYIYDFLKRNDEKFTEAFGLIFEKYIAISLKEIKSCFKTENDLRKLLGNKEKVVDYLIDDEILIECKGIEQKPIAGINPFNKIAYRALKDSIIKAYTMQMLNVVNNLGHLNIEFGIIVTYKEFYYSSLEDLWAILEEDVNAFCIKNNLKKNPLPPERVFVIGLDTWDLIIQIVKNKKVTLKEILQKAFKNNSEEKTKNKFFQDHLRDYKAEKITLEYLKKEYEKLSVDYNNK